jgi:hypothetical protein
MRFAPRGTTALSRSNTADIALASHAWNEPATDRYHVKCYQDVSFTITARNSKEY